MARLDYTCKICQRPGYVLLDTPGEHDDVEAFRRATDTFVPLLTCNRCWDWRHRASNLCDRMAVLANRALLARREKKSTRRDIEEAIRENMLTTCQAFILNNHNHTGCDAEGANNLASRCFEQPERAVMTMRADYRRRINALEQQWANKELNPSETPNSSTNAGAEQPGVENQKS